MAGLCDTTFDATAANRLLLRSSMDCLPLASSFFFLFKRPSLASKVAVIRGRPTGRICGEAVGSWCAFRRAGLEERAQARRVASGDAGKSYSSRSSRGCLTGEEEGSFGIGREGTSSRTGDTVRVWRLFFPVGAGREAASSPFPMRRARMSLTVSFKGGSGAVMRVGEVLRRAWGGEGLAVVERILRGESEVR